MHAVGDLLSEKLIIPPPKIDTKRKKGLVNHRYFHEEPKQNKHHILDKIVMQSFENE